MPVFVSFPHRIGMAAVIKWQKIADTENDVYVDYFFY